MAGREGPPQSGRAAKVGVSVTARPAVEVQWRSPNDRWETSPVETSGRLQLIWMRKYEPACHVEEKVEGSGLWLLSDSLEKLRSLLRLLLRGNMD